MKRCISLVLIASNLLFFVFLHALQQPAQQGPVTLTFVSGYNEQGAKIYEEIVLSPQQLVHLKNSSETIKNLVQDIIDLGQPITEITILEVVIPRETLHLIITYANLFAEMKRRDSIEILGAYDLRKALEELSDQELIDLIKAANYLDIKPLYQLSANEYSKRALDELTISFIFFNQNNLQQYEKSFKELGLDLDTQNFIVREYFKKNKSFTEWLINQNIIKSPQVLATFKDIAMMALYQNILAIKYELDGESYIALLNLVNNQIDLNKQVDWLENLIVWKPDGSQLAVQNGDEIEIYDNKLEQIKMNIPASQVYTTCEWNPDGSQFAIATNNDLIIYDANSWNIIKQTTLPFEIRARIIWHPKLPKIMTASRRSLYIYDVNLGQQVEKTIYEIIPDIQSITDISVHPEGNFLVAGYLGGLINYNFETEEHSFEAGGLKPRIVEFSPNGIYLGIATDKKIYIYDGTTLDLRYEFAKMRTAHFVWSADSKKIITLDDQNDLTSWTIQDDELIRALNNMNLLQLQLLTYLYQERSKITNLSDLPTYLIDLFGTLPASIQKLFATPLEEYMLLEPIALEELGEEKKMEIEKYKRELEEAAESPAAKRQKRIKEVVEKVGEFEEQLKSEFEKYLKEQGQ